MFAEVVLAAAATPASDADRVARALAWLEPQLISPAWSKADLEHANVGGKHAVVDAIVAWLELVRTDRIDDGEFLGRLDARIRSHLGANSGALGAFSNWTDGVAALYCAERELRGRGGRDALERIVRGFAERQNGEGGWDHGSSFGVPFYPSTLIATTNLALVAIGFAKRFGIACDAEVREAGLTLLGDVQGATGGMPYGGRPYLKGIEAGRTCGTMLAYSSLGLGGDPRCLRAQRYVQRNIDSIPEGHASPAFHVFIGALACSALGPAATASFDERVLARVRAAQRADGSFDSIVEGSPDEMLMMCDADTNRAYVTALEAGAILAHGSRIATTLRMDSPATPSSIEASNAPKLEPVWQFPSNDVALTPRVGKRVLVFTRAGDCRRLSIEDGRASAPFALGSGAPTGEMESTNDENGVFVFAAPDSGEVSLPISGTMPVVERRAAQSTAVAFVSADEHGPQWTRAIEGRVVAAIVDRERIFVRTLSGRVLALSRADGALLQELPALGLLPNVAFASDGAGGLVVAAESVLSCFDAHAAAGARDVAPHRAWERQNRLRGLTPPAWTDVAFDGHSIVAGRSDGSIIAMNPSDGVSRCETRVGSSIRRLAADRSSGRVFALTHDGRLAAFDAGKLVWTRDIDDGREAHAEPRLVLSEKHLWIASPARDAVICCSGDDGHVLAESPWKSDQPWSARDGMLFVAGPDGVTGSRVP